MGFLPHCPSGLFYPPNSFTQINHRTGFIWTAIVETITEFMRFNYNILSRYKELLREKTTRCITWWVMNWLMLFNDSEYKLNIKSSKMRWAGHVTRMGEKRNAYSILVGKPEGKRPLGRQRRRWVENLWEIGWSGVDSIDLAQDRDQWRAIVNTVVSLWVPLNAGNFLSSCTTGGF
jgi:hypothetical protein